MKTCVAILLCTGIVAWAQLPNVPPGSIVNGASFSAAEPITGGSLISIFGTNLSSSMQHASTIPLSKQLGGVTVHFVNPTTNAQIDAPMLDVLPGQLNLQVPWNLVPPNSSQLVTVVVQDSAGSSQATQVTVGPFSPGIFAVGSHAVAVNNADGALAWPTGSVSGVTSHPAKVGDVLIIYATGLGAVDSPVADGANSLDKLRQTLTAPTVLVGGVTAQLIPSPASVLSPQFVGVYQVAFFVPNMPAGDTVPLQIQMGGVTSPNTVSIAISQ